MGCFSSFRYSSEQIWRNSDVIIDYISMFLFPKYWLYPKVILYKICVGGKHLHPRPPGATPGRKARYE